MEPKIGDIVWLLGYEKAIIKSILDVTMADNSDSTHDGKLYIITLVDKRYDAIVPKFMFTLTEGGTD